MKGTFSKSNKNLALVEETLQKHEPYALLAISTTGLNDNEFNAHCPTRVVLKVYDYDNELKDYKENPAFTFDKTVKASDEALAVAEKNINDGKYDVFQGAGINLDEYKSGKGVTPTDVFISEFLNRAEELAEQGTTLVINGGMNGMKFANDYLSPLNSSLLEPLKKLELQGKVLSQSEITKDYMAFLGVKDKATLEALSDRITPYPYYTFGNELLKNQELSKEFADKPKDEFLAAHSEISEKAYDATKAEKEKRSKIQGTDTRVSVMNKFMHVYGQQIGVLEHEVIRASRESTQAGYEQMSAKGKRDYLNSTVEEKMQKLNSWGRINEQANEYDKLMAAVEDDTKKGVVFIHTASTGFNKLRSPKNTGEPIQFTAVAYQRGEDGKINFNDPKGFTINIACGRNAFIEAESKAKSGEYNTFAATGIDMDLYKQRLGEMGIVKNAEAAKTQDSTFKLQSTDDALQFAKRFFDMYPPSEYPIIAAGKDKATGRSFAQTCMSNIANLAAFKKEDYIDFTQAVKDYVFDVEENSKHEKNVLFKNEDMNNKGFTLPNLGAANGIETTTTSQKCTLMSTLTARLEEQRQLERGEITQEAQQEVTQEPVKEEKTAEHTEKAQPVEEAKNAESNGVSKEEFDKAVSQREQELDEKAILDEAGVIDSISDEDLFLDDVVFNEEEEDETEIEAKENVEETKQPSVKKEIEKPSSEKEPSPTKPSEPPVPRTYSPRSGSSRLSQDMNKTGEPRGRYGRNAPVSPIRHPSAYIPPEASSEGSKAVTNNSSEQVLLAAIETLKEAINNANAVNKELLAANEKLTVRNEELTKTNTEILAKIANGTLEILEGNQQLLKGIIDGREAVRSNEKVAAIEQPSPAPELDSGESVINYLEEIKSQINSISEQVSPKTAAALTKANNALSDGQQEIVKELNKDTVQQKAAG